MVECVCNPLDKIELLFKNIDTDLDAISTRLQSDGDAQNGSPQDNHMSVMNLASLLSRFREIKQEYKGITESITEIEAAERDAVEFMSKSAKSIAESFSQLAAEVEQKQELASIIEESNQFSSTLDEKKSEDSGPRIDVVDVSAIQDEFSVKGPTLQPVVKQKACKLQIPTKVEHKSHAGGFIPIHERTFLMVSELVRGKAKLAEVNATYEKLWKYFKEEKNTKPLTSVDMDKMSLRVSGKTGMAKLKVLQSLKILQMSSKGEVLKLL